MQTDQVRAKATALCRLSVRKKTQSRKSVDDVDENCNFKARLLQREGRVPIVLEMLLQLKKSIC